MSLNIELQSTLVQSTYHLQTYELTDTLKICPKINIKVTEMYEVLSLWKASDFYLNSRIFKYGHLALFQ